MVVGLHHAQITIPKGLEDQGKRFYCDILGFTEKEKPESLQGRGGFWLAAGDAEVHVGTEEGFDRTTTKAHLAYEVTDLGKWKQKLEKEGIEILEGIPIPGFDRFEFRDPFGNRIEMIQRIT
ncbi:glyoxalase [Jeotgalibacillus malaysiensis]|uniref:Glyoxalase n=1 Tax=Jeotgalibacillus malaysiensis TaxID=1508404 RepID=A0A0B5AWG3_9BACL|nr:VOC family protein [Jeotgalibacillus malaysiensis]AJD92923.1 glyoxalase [Jeotgalibacillus malaysiensis]